jgi:hypothetical protein
VFANAAVVANCPVMATDALIRRHLAPPAHPLSAFRLGYLPLVENRLCAAFRFRCAFDSDAWRARKGTTKLHLIESSIATDKLAYGRVSMMLKKEVNLVNFHDGKLPNKARAIQFCVNLRTAYQEATAQYSFGHALAEATAQPVRFNGVDMLLRYTAEMAPHDVADFALESERLRAHYVDSFLDERDGKNWDANVQLCHREALAEFYGRVDSRLQAVATASMRVDGRYCNGNTRIDYHVDGTVKSGHWDTSSGNGALNIEVTAQATASLPVRLRPVRIRALIMGDDLLIWCYFDRRIDPQEYCDAMNCKERELGICPERGVFRDVLNVSFCSSGFYWTKTGSLVFVPKLGRTFGKLFWTVTPLNGRDPQRIASTIAHAFYPALHSYRPMRHFLRHHMKVPPIEVDPSEYQFYIGRWSPRWEGVQWHEGNIVKYGLLPGTLDDITECLTAPAVMVNHPAVNVMLRQDNADPRDRRGVLAC